jgi:acyl-CoA synthetase (AMP-forming)/AMP-acid ligase II/1-acyl-sn-glycerol-3-phosphate acyltransferase/acyl carrier protein
VLGAIRWCLWAMAAVVLSLRYRVKVTGLEKVRGLTKTIILPNHPAYVDPLLVYRTVWPVLRPRPMLFEGLFKNPVLFWVPRVLDAVAIPDLSEHSVAARQQAERAIQSVIEGLQAGNNHILWPAGHVWHEGREKLGAARSLAEVLAAVPEANVVVVRTRGLWGSSFSYARTGKAPKLVGALLKGAGILLANLLVLAPRRQVEIAVEKLERGALPANTREQLNPFFEAWYNAPGGAESPTFVPYHFALGRREYAFPRMEGGAEIDLSTIKPDVRRQVAQFIAERLKRDPMPSDEQPDTNLEVLGLDSLDRMELSLDVERRFGFTGSVVPVTIGDLWVLAGGQLKAAPPAPPPAQWFERHGGETPKVLAETIGEAFVRRVMAGPTQVAVADSISGVLTYRRVLVGALLLSRELEGIAAPNVGLMLPAGVAMDTLLMACYLAGKLPVVMNWTTGPANLAHAAKLTGLTHVVTSKRFVDRANVTVEGAQYVFLEDVRTRMGRMRKLRALLSVTLWPGRLLRRVAGVDPDRPAVVLFTSGSEKAPKAVPQTHRNILSNIASILGSFEIHADDILVGFLPAFHSFGLTATAILPLLTGIRAVYHPDPTDAAAIARKIAGYKATLICGTPTFLSYILQRATPEDLQSIRLAVAGAEKCPEALFERAAQMMPRLQLLEAYGITECSPAVTGNRPGRSKRGSLGLPLPGITVRVVDIDSQEPVATGQMGMLWVAGPNVFPGYMGEAPHPFVERDGQRWYVTGDLGKIDEDGYVWFLGRLKRFLKAGGEMISLPAIEEPLACRYPPTENGPQVAVEGVEKEDGRRIVLFTTVEMSLRQGNEILQGSGLRGIFRLDEVRRVEKIPTLGTGKTDYRVLRSWIVATQAAVGGATKPA